METLRSKTEVIWFEPELLNMPPETCFEAPYWLVQNKVVGSAKGRGTTWFVQLEGLQGALRHYRRGGLFGKLIKDHYWFTGWDNTRSFQEFTLLQYLRGQGVNVPRPIAARASKFGPIYTADLLSERIPNAQDLVAKLQSTSLSREIYEAIGQQIKQLHLAQVNHTDLNIHNILLDGHDKVWIIDFDKCSEQSGDDWKENNLARLKRSFLKEVERFDIHWDEDEWEHLLSGYNTL
ncbi:3-deoxy-D-manno-octulosonic acid kinase [Vibrio breoganii]|uniref:3-deoxy-D-manno-octulosonic acid kinase n=1 Tax=Vibrio breoganii TaxID=553239 RepID=UPI000C847206|nr:3-deoxy-D-manno-octulosonic acid kinase [Vibrio breoganii]PMK30901.1 3-deoxy-D-manno-octulosonic acid kinase [Vibrio breoganii]PML14579.1 3-deoxy-D-manno-octulosonic acid kinase [Vibrio breoganii]PML79864.1 3-deoxy-D-manno-octulosonic acid kinase [Vibrio breoganii]PMO97435.1 3-deoxy-D-manno-octulosonic acid kinase [Vibrio breoganii]